MTRRFSYFALWSLILGQGGQGSLTPSCLTRAAILPILTGMLSGYNLTEYRGVATGSSDSGRFFLLHRTSRSAAHVG